MEADNGQGFLHAGQGTVDRGQPRATVTLAVKEPDLGRLGCFIDAEIIVKLDIN